jgi:ABC-type multidrug transport system fused ATPase/permease subunit
MFAINIYFLVKYPKIGAINIIGNIVNLMLILRSAPVLIQSSNERENRFIKMVGKLEENFNNLLNIYLNDKTKDTIKDNEEIETKYIDIYRAQNKELEQFSGRLKVNNYLFSFISMYMLYKQTTDHSELVNCLLIFTFYLGTLENMSEDIPFSLMTLGNIKNIEEALVAKDPNHVRVHPIYTEIDRTIMIKDVKGKIDFDNVWFRYYTNEDKYVLKNFSLHIKEGAKIALVSQSGFGKTTSMKLLLGFYKPEKGNILLDGVNIKDIPLNQLRTYINYINQKTFLFHDTIINNMKYGNTKTTEFIIEFLKNNDLITIFCDGKGSVLDCLNKTVEKNGTNISMGMQKVIFLVRGILKDNTSVYVFDEPLTSIDPVTRAKVLRMIQKETSTKTMIIITHDKEVSSIVDSTINLSELNSL